jgi:hypothetical protein
VLSEVETDRGRREESHCEDDGADNLQRASRSVGGLLNAKANEEDDGAENDDSFGGVKFAIEATSFGSILFSHGRCLSPRRHEDAEMSSTNKILDGNAARDDRGTEVVTLFSVITLRALYERVKSTFCLEDGAFDTALCLRAKPRVSRPKTKTTTVAIAIEPTNT